MSLKIVALLAFSAGALTARAYLPDGVGRTRQDLSSPPDQELGSPAALSPVRRDGETRCEYFVMEGPSESAEGASGSPQPEALVAFRRVESGPDVLLERDVTFQRGDVQVLLDERVRKRPLTVERLVFRELRGEASPGRTWVADWDRGEGGLRTMTWGDRGRVHGWLPGDERPLSPLALIEDLRRGPTVRETALRIDPLRRAAEPVVIRERVGDPSGLLRSEATRIDAVPPAQQEPCRTVEVHRLDGSLVGRYVLRGQALVAFQWQDGARRARRIDADEYRSMLRGWRPVLGPVEASAPRPGEGR